MAKRTITTFLIVLPVLLLLALGGWLAVRTLNRPEKALWGSWEISADLASEAIPPAREWLSDAVLGETIGLSERMKSIDVTLVLTFAEDGIWTLAVEEASYENALEAAREGLADALRELLAARLAAAGADELSGEELEREIQEAIGMSTMEYLREYGPDLLPSYEELQLRYGRRGTYRVEDGYLIREEGAPESYLVNGEMLALTGSGTDGAVVYRRAGAAESAGGDDGETGAKGNGESGEDREDE